MPRFPRASGLLLHPTSLPGPHGIGDLGRSALDFLDFLARSRQHLWQVLPLTPTGYGDSPYAAPSAFAGNPLLVALEPLREGGLLGDAHLEPLARLPQDCVDFGQLIPFKRRALEMAFQRFQERGDAGQRERFAAFRQQQAAWLDDYALFAALHDAHPRAWTEWEPSLRDRDPEALAAAHERSRAAVDFHAFVQHLFFEQWSALHAAARERGIRIVGDIPIFVAHDSADVWAHRGLFKLDERGRPSVVAGVPPDYFSPTGQLWGNPMYAWEAVAAQGYDWWVARFRHLLSQVDVLRIDHFRGFEAAWEVPADATTAESGRWVPGPGTALFRAVEAALGQALPIVAEDLGLITDAVRALLGDLGYPGMKVLQFAFSGDPHHPYLPHAYADAHVVVYTGTHDNDTMRGWYASAPESERDFARRYLGSSGEDIAWDCIRLALESVADTVIVPLQDVLDLGSETRMNRPGVSDGNWQWRVRREQLRPEVADRLAGLTWIYGRA